MDESNVVFESDAGQSDSNSDEHSRFPTLLDADEDWSLAHLRPDDPFNPDSQELADGNDGQWSAASQSPDHSQMVSSQHDHSVSGKRTLSASDIDPTNTNPAKKRRLSSQCLCCCVFEHMSSCTTLIATNASPSPSLSSRKRTRSLSMTQEDSESDDHPNENPKKKRKTAEDNASKKRRLDADSIVKTVGGPARKKPRVRKHESDADTRLGCKASATILGKRRRDDADDSDNEDAPPPKNVKVCNAAPELLC